MAAEVETPAPHHSGRMSPEVVKETGAVLAPSKICHETANGIWRGLAMVIVTPDSTAKAPEREGRMERVAGMLAFEGTGACPNRRQ